MVLAITAFLELRSISGLCRGHPGQIDGPEWEHPLRMFGELPLSCVSGFKSQDYDMWKNEKEERRVGVSFLDDKRKDPDGE